MTTIIRTSDPLGTVPRNLCRQSKPAHEKKRD